MKGIWLSFLGNQEYLKIWVVNFFEIFPKNHQINLQLVMIMLFYQVVFSILNINYMKSLVTTIQKFVNIHFV